MDSIRVQVATRVGGIVEFLERFEAGVLTHSDARSIGKELLGLRSDPVRAASVGARGRLLAQGELNWSVIVDQLNKFYSEVLDQTQRSPSPAAVSTL